MVQERIRLSLIIPAKDENDPKLKELIASIDVQDFPKDQLEILVITEGTSESAKAIGIRRAKGEVIGILASDNELPDGGFLSYFYTLATIYGTAYPGFYWHTKSDDILNRYFALIGGNDPLSYYMGKNDRFPLNMSLYNSSTPKKTYGDNGFFCMKEYIEKTDLDNYYHIDNANELPIVPYPSWSYIWHKTGGNIFSFFAKRYRYGLQHAFNPNRRWHLVDFHQPKDIMRLLWFIFCSVTLLEPFILSLRGYSKVRDMAWFLHPVVCLLTLLTYGCLVAHLCMRGMYQSLFAPMAVRRA